MSNGDGMRPPGAADKSLGEIVSEVSEKASLLVREEIELAKAEVRQKVSSITKGAVVATVAGTFLVFGVVMLLHTFAWFLVDLLDASIWVGFAIVTAILIGLGVGAGLWARSAFRKGSPPTPDMAIEEAKVIRETFEGETVERDQLERTGETVQRDQLERAEETVG
jgi:uncharacterized membrane protein YqjE